MRHLRLLALFCATLAPALTQSLDVSTGLDGMVDRYLTTIAEQQFAARKAAITRLRTTADVEARQRYIRQKLTEEIGGFPARTPLNARITGTLDRPGYRVEKLIFESQPHYYVTANVYVPASAPAPYPAVLGTAGHSLDGKAENLYQHVWISLAKRGFLVLAFDPPGQGERLEYLNPATGKSFQSGGGTGEHGMAGAQCLLTGSNLARYMIWDGIRAFDYLITRPDVDPKRIAVAGNSGGGTQSSYLAALEPRLAAAAPSCYLTAWEKMWITPGPQDAEQVFANFLKDGLDFPDFLLAFAPKPIHMATATRDYFPIEGARATYAEVRSLFQLLGSADHVGFFEFDDTHGWSKPRREATYRWLTRWMQNRQDDGVEEPGLQVNAPKDLQCTTTGQIATDFPGAATVQSLNAELAGELYAKRAGGAHIPDLVKARLNLATGRGAPAATKRGEIARDGYRIEKVELRPEPGITLPALVFVPAGEPARKPAVLYVNSAGKAADAAEGSAIEKLARAGNLVLALDARGWGESATQGPRPGSHSSYQTAMRALLVGKNLAGMRTGDVLRAFDYLLSRSDVAPGRISVIGKGNGGLPALYAAAVEPRIAKVTCENMPPTYLEIARLPTHGDITDIVTPGVLRDFDTPDVISALGGRASVLNPTGLR